MGIFLLFILAAIFCYQALKHYEDTAKYNDKHGEDTPFFSFMFSNHPFASIGLIVFFFLLIYIGFS